MKEFFEKKPSIEESICQAQKIFESLPKKTISTRQLTASEDVVSPTTYKSQEM